jgi:SAM-dependent methyltransferase
MNHFDHLDLLREGVPDYPARRLKTVWADFGSGSGAFTFALAELLGAGAQIHSIDTNPWVFERQKEELRLRFPGIILIDHKADFMHPIDLPELDGIVMANSLHFVPRGHQMSVVNLLKGYLNPGGRLILVEYNVDRGNYWVPYPLSFHSWEGLAQKCGFSSSHILAKKPSSFLNEIYSAINYV